MGTNKWEKKTEIGEAGSYRWIETPNTTALSGEVASTGMAGAFEGVPP